MTNSTRTRIARLIPDLPCITPYAIVERMPGKQCPTFKEVMQHLRQLGYKATGNGDFVKMEADE